MGPIYIFSDAGARRHAGRRRAPDAGRTTTWRGGGGKRRERAGRAVVGVHGGQRIFRGQGAGTLRPMVGGRKVGSRSTPGGRSAAAGRRGARVTVYRQCVFCSISDAHAKAAFCTGVRNGTGSDAFDRMFGVYTTRFGSAAEKKSAGFALGCSRNRTQLTK